MEITRQPVKVLYMETNDTPQGIPLLFNKLFSLIPDPQNRKCFGASTGPTGTYRACLEKMEGDDVHALGMQEWERIYTEANPHHSLENRTHKEYIFSNYPHC